MMLAFQHNSNSKALTAQQRSLWFLACLAPENAAYNIAHAFRIVGKLDFEALCYAISRLTAKHEILRSTFVDEEGVPKAIVKDELKPDVEVFDASLWNSVQLEHALQKYYSIPFDLENGPCFRLGVFQSEENESILLLIVHHIVSDFSSLGILMDELEVLYAAEINYPIGTWLERSRPFNEFISEEIAYLASADALAAKKYWSTLLKNPPPPLEWRSSLKSHVTAGCSSKFFSVSERLTDKLRNFSNDSGVSIYPIVLAAWAVFIGQKTQSSDVIVGAPVSVRSMSFKNTVGCFFNVVPIRLNTDSTSFLSLIKAAQKGVLDALEHRFFSFHAIVDELKVPRYPNQNPLFQTTVNMLGTSKDSKWTSLLMADNSTRVPWADIYLAPCRLCQQEGQVDLALEFIDAGTHLQCVLKGRAELFLQGNLRKIVNSFSNVLERFIDLPNDPVTAAFMLNKHEIQCLVSSINPHVLLNPPNENIVTRFDRRVLAHGDNVAITDASGSLTYQELQQASYCITRWLRSVGIGPGDRVGLALSPSANALASMIGVMRAGAAYVPLDPHGPPSRIQKMVAAAEIRVALTEEVDKKFSLPEVNVIAISDISQSPDDGFDNLTNCVWPSSVAYSVFTSGSTGEPKGIDVLHQNVASFLDAMNEEIAISPKDGWTWFHALSFDFSVWEIWGCICSGGTLVVVPPTIRSQPDMFLKLIEESGVQMLAQTPSSLKQLLPELRRKGKALPVRNIVVCGEPLPGEIARQFLAGQATLWNMYGPAEATVFATIEKVTSDLSRYDVVPIGRPLLFASVYLLDEKMNLVSAGEVGEICIGGLGVTPGYIGLPELTAQRFVVDPFLNNGAKLYKTGDLGMWDGKRIHFRGRVDDQIKLSGYRIEIGEVESIINKHTNISDAAVSIESGPSGHRLVAVIVPKNRENLPSEVEIRRFLTSQLPAYMLPNRILLSDSLPQNSHSKLDRKMLKRSIENGDFNEMGFNLKIPVNNLDELSSALTQIWCKVIGRSHVGLDDKFFDIGGSSLALMQVFSLVIKLPGCESLMPTDLFRFPTIRSLTGHIQAGYPNAMKAPRISKRARLNDIEAVAARRTRVRRQAN